MQLSSHQLALLGLMVVGQVNASPVNGISKLQCLGVDVVSKALSAYSSATPFCSSFPTFLPLRARQRPPAQTTTVTTCILSSAKKRDIEPRAAQLPAILSSFASQQISTACSCLSIPTPSTTVTATITTTETATDVIDVAATTDVTATTTVTVTSTSTDIVCPTPTQCNNQGLQFAEYTNSQGNNNDRTYSQFNPAIYKTQTPNFSSVTSTAGGINVGGGQTITVYGTSNQFTSDYFVLDHRGYLFATLNGTYKITVSSVDDAAFFWLGSDAYSGWTRANADATITYNGGPGSGSATVAMVEGEYLPIRIMFAQAQGNAVFQVPIAAPDGTVFLSSSTQNFPYLIQYSCDGTTAPAYATWGQES